MEGKKSIIDISVVISTHNRTGYLQLCLDSLLQQKFAQERYQIVVVDDSSNEETRELIDRKYSSFTNLHYMRVDVRSGNLARNAGVSVATGRYIAFIDDDAIPSSNWLDCIVSFFDTTEQKVGCIGGPSSVIFEDRRPIWLPEFLLPFLGQLSYGLTKIKVGHTQMFYGLNMAFERSALIESGVYPTVLSRGKTDLLSNSEYPMQINMERNGWQRWYVPCMKIQHHAPSGRLSMKWMLRRVFWQGISDAQLADISNMKRKLPLLNGDTSDKGALVLKLASIFIPTPANIFLGVAGITYYAGYMAALCKENFMIEKTVPNHNK